MVVVNGFFPGLTAKQVLVAAAAAVHRESAATRRERRRTARPTTRCSIASRSRRGARTRDRRRRGAARREGRAERPRRGEVGEIGADGVNGDFQPLRRLYIVLHNIDGQQLRSPEAQAILGELASMPRVHLIASVDHVNAPLLWSKRERRGSTGCGRRRRRSRPTRWRRSFLPQLLASKGEERHIRGAVNVLRSLTSNARDIFRLLAEHQLANPEEKGMGFHAFYTSAARNFGDVGGDAAIASHRVCGSRAHAHEEERGRGGRRAHSLRGGRPGAAAQGYKHQLIPSEFSSGLGGRRRQNVGERAPRRRERDEPNTLSFTSIKNRRLQKTAMLYRDATRRVCTSFRRRVSASRRRRSPGSCA